MRNLQDFINKPYPVVVRESQNKFCLYVPKLQIFVESDTLQSAYELLKKEKTSFYSRLEAIDSLHLIPELSDTPSLRQRIDIQKIFIERFFSFGMTLIFWLLILAIVGHQITKTSSKIQEAFVPVTAEKSQERLSHFKEKVNIAAPYLKEIKKAINE